MELRSFKIEDGRISFFRTEDETDFVGYLRVDKLKRIEPIRMLANLTYARLVGSTGFSIDTEIGYHQLKLALISVDWVNETNKIRLDKRSFPLTTIIKGNKIGYRG